MERLNYNKLSFETCYNDVDDFNGGGRRYTLYFTADLDFTNPDDFDPPEEDTDEVVAFSVCIETDGKTYVTSMISPTSENEDELSDYDWRDLEYFFKFDEKEMLNFCKKYIN